MSGGGEEKDLGLNVGRLQFAAFDFRAGIPERRGFGLDHLAHHQPLKVCHGSALQASIGRADGWVLSHDKKAVHFAIGHIEPEAEFGVVPGDARQPFKSEIVFLICGLAVPGLQQTDDVLINVVPPAGLGVVLLDVLPELVGIRQEIRNGQVARQNVVKSRNIGGALNRCVATQGQDAAAGAADVAKQ